MHRNYCLTLNSGLLSLEDLFSSGFFLFKDMNKIIEYENNIYWNYLSSLLNNTSESVHSVINPPIILDTIEDLGLSDLEKLAVNEIWQDRVEGIITFKVEGSNEEFDLTDYPEFIEQIYNKLLDRLCEI